MSTSLLCHAFGIRDYRLRCTRFDGGSVTFVIELPRRRWKCPGCGSVDVRRHSATWRRIRSLPIGRKATFLLAESVRVCCEACGQLGTIPLPFADARRGYTRPFARLVLDLGRHMPTDRIARYLGVSWDTVRDIQVRDLRARLLMNTRLPPLNEHENSPPGGGLSAPAKASPEGEPSRCR